MKSIALPRVNRTTATARAFALILLGLMFSFPKHAFGIAMGMGSLELTSFNIQPVTGTIQWAGPWTLTTFTQVANSDGAVGSDFQTGASNATSLANIPYASAKSTANLPAVGGVLAKVEGAVNIPDGVDASASVHGANAALENAFMITGATGAVDVTFTATTSSQLSATTNAQGISASSDVIFNMSIDGVPVLSFFDSVVVGSSGSAFSSMTPNLSQTISLQAGQMYLFGGFVHTEVGPTTNYPVPDHSATWLLLLGGLTALFGLRSRL